MFQTGDSRIWHLCVDETCAGADQDELDRWRAQPLQVRQLRWGGGDEQAITDFIEHLNSAAALKEDQGALFSGAATRFGHWDPRLVEYAVKQFCEHKNEWPLHQIFYSERRPSDKYLGNLFLYSFEASGR